MARKKTKITKTPEEWGNLYEQKRDIYLQYTTKLKSLIEELLKKNKIEFAQIEYRTKKMRSLVEKIQREGKYYKDPLSEITDLVGIRIITYYKEDVEKINKIIEKEFDVDWENSSDKADLLDPDRFGYLSFHYVISLSTSRKKLPEWDDFAGITAEIQVRTVLQHAWAAISHKLTYKRIEEAPQNIRRQLSRLSALLELTDEEFSSLRRRTLEVEEKYTKKVEKGKLDIALDLSSLDAYLESTKQHLKWMKIVEQAGFRYKLPPLEKIEEITNEEKRILLRFLQLTDVRKIRELDEILNNAKKWGRKTLSFCFETFSLDITNILIVPIDIIFFLVIYAKRDVVSDDILARSGVTIPLMRSAILKAIGKAEYF